MLAKTSNGVISARATTLSLSLAIVTIQRWWCDLYWWNVKDQYSLPPSQFQWKGVFVWGFGFNYPSFSLAKQFNFGDISRKSPRVSQGDGAGSKCYGILIKQVGYWFAFSPLMMKIYWLYVWLFWQTKSFMAIAHTWNKSNWGNMRVWPSTCSLPYHTVPLCIRIYIHGLPPSSISVFCVFCADRVSRHCVDVNSGWNMRAEVGQGYWGSNMRIVIIPTSSPIPSF